MNKELSTNAIVNCHCEGEARGNLNKLVWIASVRLDAESRNDSGKRESLEILRRSRG